ncbi:DnaJ-like protein [Tilletia horrida]|uniref:DnaJ-like protein n=1 Tax=Tilletia horrida TaxID=155126 RepID=A0AAN6GW66_9BASI|nr:DnaJ-like protein [Tilletia horrida]
MADQAPVTEQGAAASGVAQDQTPKNINRDGFKVADMEFYDLLDVSAHATDLELKKAYRKAAIRNHPDKGGDEETFKMVGEAYRVLSDNNLRADYDKHGKKKPVEEVGIKEATEMFGNIFGGERFVDLIGEISLLKDMTKASEIVMSDEEKAEMEKELRAQAAAANGEAPPQGTVEGETSTKPDGEAAATAAATTATPSEGKPTSSGRQKLTPEQKAKLEEFEKEKDAEKEKRVHDLTEKLKDRIRPFVEARNPGDKDDSETQVWAKRMSEEAEDLKLESFGVELLHTIGGIYITKSTTWIKSRKHNFLGLPGFFSKLKDRGSQVKDIWGLYGSAVSVQISMEELAKRQEKGDIGEEELKQLEADMSGKMLLVTWRGTRFEVNNVLRRVCENVLNEPGVNKVVLLRRAQALTLLGAIYTKVQPDPDQGERREMEELVANAANKRKKSKAARDVPTPPTAGAP